MLVKPMKGGVTSISLIDCCHSANIFDLPYTFSSDDTEMKTKPEFDMSIITEALRPLSAKEKTIATYREKKKKEKAERLAKKELEQPVTEASVLEVPVPTMVTKNSSGQVMISGNPTSEEILAIQQQMIHEAQAAAQAQMALIGGGRAQVMVMPIEMTSGSGVAPSGMMVHPPKVGNQNTRSRPTHQSMAVKVPPVPATISKSGETKVPSPKYKADIPTNNSKAEITTCTKTPLVSRIQSATDPLLVSSEQRKLTKVPLQNSHQTAHRSSAKAKFPSDTIQPRKINHLSPEAAPVSTKPASTSAPTKNHHVSASVQLKPKLKATATAAAKNLQKTQKKISTSVGKFVEESRDKLNKEKTESSQEANDSGSVNNPRKIMPIKTGKMISASVGKFIGDSRDKLSKMKDERAASQKADDSASACNVKDGLECSPVQPEQTVGEPKCSAEMDNGPSIATPHVASISKNTEQRPVNTKTGNNAVYYSADDLRMKRIPGLDYSISESYLSPAEFTTIFGFTKEEFDKLPQWKRASMKRQHKLF